MACSKTICNAAFYICCIHLKSGQCEDILEEKGKTLLREPEVPREENLQEQQSNGFKTYYYVAVTKYVCMSVCLKVHPMECGVVIYYPTETLCLIRSLHKEG